MPVQTSPGAGESRERKPAPPVALSLACLGIFVVTLDAVIVSVALPQIGRDLLVAPGDLSWVVNAYTLAFGGALLLGGRLTDRYGTRVTFATGLGLFGLASLACGLATAVAPLVAARAVQGLGGAILMPATLTIVTGAYPDGPARSRALAWWSAVGSTGAASGTVAGGLLTAAVGWRWVFLVNVPLAVAGAVATPVILPGGRRRRQRLDVIGAVLATAGLAVLVYGVLTTGTRGWGSPVVTGALAAAAVLLAAFVLHQARWSAAPLVPPGLFRARPVRVANLVMFGLGFGFFASPVLLSAYAQDVLGYAPLEAGLVFLPAAVTLFMGAQAAGRLTHRLGIRGTVILGALVAGTGFVFLTRLSAHTAYWPGLAVPAAAFGLGIGTAFTPVTVAATRVVPAQAGVAAGVLNTTRQVSAALGLAVLSTLISTRTAAGTPDPASGYDLAFLVAAAAVLLAAVGALGLPGQPSGRSALITARGRAKRDPRSQGRADVSG